MPTKKAATQRAPHGRSRSKTISHASAPIARWKLSASGERALLAGAGAVVLGTLATAGVLMRRPLARLAMDVAAYPSKVLERAGIIRRPSLLRRLLPAVGALAGLAVAAGTTLFLMAPRLAASAGTPRGSVDRGAPMDDANSHAVGVIHEVHDGVS